MYDSPGAVYSIVCLLKQFLDQGTGPQWLRTLFLLLLIYWGSRCYHRPMHIFNSLKPGVVSSGNAWERRSQSYFHSGNGVPRNSIARYSFVTLFVNTPRLTP